MFQDQQASIALFSYRRAPAAQAGDIVRAIDGMLQGTDAQPRRINWVDDGVAMIDRIGVRIAIALLPPSPQDRYAHLVLAVGAPPDAHETDDPFDVSYAHLADRLVYRVKEDMPYDAIMRGETPEAVDHALVRSLYDLLRQSSPVASPVAPPAGLANLGTRPRPDAPGASPHPPVEERFDIILSEDVPGMTTSPPEWLRKRAAPTKPLRLAVHTMALSIMLFTPPLGAFLFTYSMLRDITDDN
ncbi:hypothetical protein [Roseovarius atlanticus]|uniref:hypothetical protein n=1 Tax=Roseovarius atlanticus TaxID=1641875 RepID=UPI001C94191A|nr:hypothetical protein [Roseovarius atlanticus]MBY5988370.1 hypothetical protein [Roseovarius atlanticus]MBY6123761.1 hypothetical protein [Roseovarius atlanticus]MBY6148256.1 hypothetical protein [Roseovarius atlanticus]